MERRQPSPPETDEPPGQFCVRRSLPGRRAAYGEGEDINGVALGQWYEDVVADKRGVLMIDTPTGALEVDEPNRDLTDRIDGALFD